MIKKIFNNINTRVPYNRNKCDRARWWARLAYGCSKYLAPGGVIDQVTDPRRMTLLSSVGLNGRRGENVAG